MQTFLLGLFLFIVGCFGGWLLELVFRRLFTVKKWVNPGFMKGPWLPLYGFGVIVMFVISFLFIHSFPNSVHFYNPLGGLFGRDYKSGATAWDLVPISLMWIGMVTLEFVAGLIFIKGFKVKLWDYSNMKGNILGIICPVFNILWLLVAVIFYYALDPFIYVLSTNMHKYMFGGEGKVAHFGFIFSLGLVYGIMLYDFVVSVGAFNAISKFARKTGVLDRYENMKQKWMEFKESKGLVKEEKEKQPSAIKAKISEFIYIDPEKEKEKDKNYDENGRPIKIE